METLNDTRTKINAINSKIKQSSESTRKQVADVNLNRDFTQHAKNLKIQQLERNRDKEYADFQQQKGGIVSDTMKTLSERLYAGKTENPIQFDNAVYSFVNSDQKELITRLKQNPSDETKRAIYKASVVSENAKFETLATASDLYPDDKDKISDYFEFQQEFGALESRQDKLSRKLFGEQV